MSTDAGFYRRLVEASRDGLWVIDSSGTTTYCNQAMADMLGRSIADVLATPAAEMFDEQGKDDLARHLAELEAAPDDDPGADNHEVQLVLPDGEVVWALASHSPVRDESGRRIAWMHRVTENTEQKRLVDALATREALLADAQEISAIGSWEWDVASDVVTWSDQLYRIYNITPGEFEATYASFLHFIHPDDRSIVEEAVGSVFAGEDEFEWQARVIPLDGGIRWVRGLGRVERDADGAPLRMGGTAQDITERVLADHAAEEATRRLHLLQSMASAANQTARLEEAIGLMALGMPAFTTWLAIASYHYDADGRVVGFDDLSSNGDGWRPPTDPDLAERSRASGAVEHTPAPGREETHSIVALPVQRDGRTTCVILLLADELPPDDNSRQLLEQISVQLSQVAQRESSLAALAEARDEAMEASRLKSEFLATMSHEIRTPMNGVIGLNDLLLRSDLDAHQRRLAEGLQGAGLTLLGIINDILDLSKIEAGKLELEEVDFDVRQVFDKTADVLSRPAHEKGLELVVACHPDVPEVLRGDPGRIGQVLANLGSNAVKFTESGEVSIRATVESETDERVVLRIDVSDTGVGVDPAQVETLFDAFTQADPSTTREHGGTGLGLAICRQLAEMLGGRIWVEPHDGPGTTFSFTVDLARTTGRAPRRTAGADPELLRGRRVLVVDDNATNRLILEEQLGAWEMQTVSAGTAEEAMASMRSASRDGEPFEVVVLDLLLPDGDGLALARAITAGSPGSPPRLVLLSSGAGVDPASVRAAGIEVSLTKPVRQSELHDAMMDALAGGTVSVPEDRTPEVEVDAGRRILVVEDNQVNQMVAVGLLEGAGYATHVVGDGLEAVEELGGGHEYAAVLMDCRMPRLDGFDATRQIREQEAGGRRVPIIAMTASALEGEHERCLAAGMDDFLTKPVDPVRLLRVVRRWVDNPLASAGGTGTPPPPEAVVSPVSAASPVPSETPVPMEPQETEEPEKIPVRVPLAAVPEPSAPPADPAPAPEASAEPEPEPVDPGPVDPGPRLVTTDPIAPRDLLGDGEEVPVADRARMKLLDDMRRDGTSLFERATANFVTNAPLTLDEVRAAVASADPIALSASAHKLKGSASNIGLPALARAAGELEVAAHSGSTAGAEPLLELLEAEMQRALAALDEIRAQGF